jgi:preprotein translocase subunit SecA
MEQWNLKELAETLRREFNINIDFDEWLKTDPNILTESVQKRILDELLAVYQQRHANVSPDVLKQLEKVVMLQQLDQHWKEHLAAMDYLRQSVGLRGYAQKDPKQEYKREAFDLFQEMIARLERQIISTLTVMKIAQAEDVQQLEEKRQHIIPDKLELHHDSARSLIENKPVQAEPEALKPAERRVSDKVGRNDPCPCGSGKKYKNCHGKLD